MENVFKFIVIIMFLFLIYSVIHYWLCKLFDELELYNDFNGMNFDQNEDLRYNNSKEVNNLSYYFDEFNRQQSCKHFKLDFGKVKVRKFVYKYKNRKLQRSNLSSAKIKHLFNQKKYLIIREIEKSFNNKGVLVYE